jgi:hypothetical protein
MANPTGSVFIRDGAGRSVAQPIPPRCETVLDLKQAYLAWQADWPPGYGPRGNFTLLPENLIFVIGGQKWPVEKDAEPFDGNLCDLTIAAILNCDALPSEVDRGVFISRPGEDAVLLGDVDLDDTVESVLARCGTSPRLFTLKSRGKDGGIVLENGKRLSDYDNIRTGATLDLVQRDGGDDGEGAAVGAVGRSE